jgi:16S rRNA (cytidine1402-2'-O)-methyltransferase
LYVVATPLGNLGDISRRALTVLSSVDLIAAEDTRHSRKLLTHYGIATPVTSFHEHNERAKTGTLLAKLAAGCSLGLISDAGTPLVSDPGYGLVREARLRGFRVSPIPGPSAVICALSASGLASDRFLFEGFAPRARSERRLWLEGLRDQPRTLVFYESSHRILESLEDLVQVFGGAREAVLARELTKLHETLLGGSLDELSALVGTDPLQRKGELVVLVAGAPASDAPRLGREAERTLRVLCEQLPVKQAAAMAAQITGVAKNRLYRQALDWKRRPG